MVVCRHPYSVNLQNTNLKSLKTMNISSLASVGTQLLGGLIGSIGSGRAARKSKKAQEEALRQQQQQNEELFNKTYYQDIMSRADTQNALRQQRELLKEQNRRQDGQAVVLGATPEAVAAAKKANTQSIANTTSNIQSAGQQIKDNALNRYYGNKMNFAQKEGDIAASYYQQKAQNFSNLGNTIAGMGQGVAGMFKK